MRQDQWSNTVVIDNEPWGIWDTLDGGDVEAEETRYRPGGMRPQVSLGGPVNVTNLDLGKLLTADYWPRIRFLMQKRCGRAKVTVNRQPLDLDGNPLGDAITYRGILQSVRLGATNSESSDAQVWEITVTPEGSVG